MPRSTRPRAPRSKSLLQQNTDLTSEGAPPPGKVAPLGWPKAAAPRHAASRTPANIPGARRRAPTGRKP